MDDAVGVPLALGILAAMSMAAAILTMTVSRGELFWLQKKRKPVYHRAASIVRLCI